MTRICFSLIILSAISWSCIDTLVIPVEDNGTSLVVVAEITDQTEEYTVALSRTASYESGLSEKEIGALVKIVDSIGNEFPFSEQRDGIYKSCPNNFVGQIGESYKLVITTSDEKVYESAMETILPTGEIDSVYFDKYSQMELIDGRSRPIRGLKFYCDFQDRPEKDFYKVDWEGTFQFRASGLDSLYDFCWKTESSSFDIRLYDDTFSNNSLKKEFEVAFLEKGFRFVIDYSFQARLKSMDADAYKFWRLVEQQSKSDGSIFSALPAQIRSNVKCISNPEEHVLGYFMVSAVATKRVRVSPYDIGIPTSGLTGCMPFRPGDPVQDYCYDCTLFQSSVGQPPEYW